MGRLAQFTLWKAARKTGEAENISINQLITLELAEKRSALGAENYLAARAQRGSEEKFRQAMAKVPESDPAESDRL